MKHDVNDCARSTTGSDDDDEVIFCFLVFMRCSLSGYR